MSLSALRGGNEGVGAFLRRRCRCQISGPSSSRARVRPPASLVAQRPRRRSTAMLSRCLRPVLAAPRARAAAPLSSSSKAAVAALASSSASSPAGSVRKTALDAARATAVHGTKRFASSDSQDGTVDVSRARLPPPPPAHELLPLRRFRNPRSPRSRQPAPVGASELAGALSTINPCPRAGHAASARRDGVGFDERSASRRNPAEQQSPPSRP